MKISEWLAELDSHEIYESDLLEADFIERVGKIPCWPSLTAAQMRRQIASRGLSGDFDAGDGERFVCGNVVAEYLADKYGTHKEYMTKRGLGSRFRKAMESIIEGEVAEVPA